MVLDLQGTVGSYIVFKHGESSRGVWERIEFILDGEDGGHYLLGGFGTMCSRCKDMSLSEGMILNVKVKLNSRESKGRWFLGLDLLDISYCGMNSSDDFSGDASGDVISDVEGFLPEEGDLPF